MLAQLSDNAHSFVNRGKANSYVGQTKLTPCIDKHLVITSSHPSPLGATKTDKPFIGSKCFSRTNEYLQKTKQAPIDWRLG